MFWGLPGVYQAPVRGVGKRLELVSSGSVAGWQDLSPSSTREAMAAAASQLPPPGPVGLSSLIAREQASHLFPRQEAVGSAAIATHLPVAHRLLQWGTIAATPAKWPTARKLLRQPATLLLPVHSSSRDPGHQFPPLPPLYLLQPPYGTRLSKPQEKEDSTL